jgi:hypothetical protein
MIGGLRRTTIAAVVATVSLAAGTTGAAAQTSPFGLTGETLVAFALPLPIGSSAISGTCDPTSTSTFTFTTSGGAAGPYPGTYVEQGTFTIGPAPTFTVLSFSSSFTITSVEGTVTGTKTLAAGGGVFARCGPHLEPGGQTADLVEVRANLDYSAEIQSATGTTTDSGTSYVEYGDTRVRDIEGLQTFSFSENYVSTSFLGASTGKSTGGGRIEPSVTFGFVASADDSGAKGTCSVVDDTTSTHVKCLDVTAYTQSATHATFSGNATVDGVPTTYRIDVDDGGEPGAGTDTFAIQTGTGYTGGGQVTSGNIQVH